MQNETRSAAVEPQNDVDTRIREIPYNYTSFSDREILLRLLGAEAAGLLDELRGERRTGRSARMLFEVLGDIWVATRNPYVQEDLLKNASRRKLLIEALEHRLHEMDKRREPDMVERDEKVQRLMAVAYKAVRKFETSFERIKTLRSRFTKALKACTAEDNIRFDPFMRAAHVTDATDLRLEYPFVVLTPDSEREIPSLVRTCIELGLVIIPRGGGTGYTGGAVPLSEMSAVINTEKLDSISRSHLVHLPECALGQMPVIDTGSGAVTRRVTEAAARDGYVFSVDPASADSSTVGGNIAENSGGKKAVLWGTAVDNIASYRMVTADGNWMEVERLEHTYAKISPETDIRWRITVKDGRTSDPEKARVLSVRRGKSSAARASAKTSPTNSSAACPPCRRKAPTASSRRRVGFCTRCRPSPTRSAWNFSARPLWRARRFSRSTNCSATATKAACSPASSILTTVTSKPSTTRSRASGANFPRW